MINQGRDGQRSGEREVRGLAHGVVGSARVIAFGASNVAPAGAVVSGLVITVSYAGFASPLVVIVAFVASLCSASSIAEFARRLPSAGWLYTYNSRGLGRTGGFLTGWMMVFAYALYVPAGIALTSAYTSQLVADTLHVTIGSGALFVVILGAVVLVAYLGVRTSSSVDLVLVTGEVAVIAALAVTILIKIGPAYYSASVLAAYGDGIPVRNVLLAIGKDVGDKPQRKLRRVDVGAAGDIFLKDIVLNGSIDLLRRNALLLCDGNVHGEQNRGCGVNRHGS